jgi:hypothetical protein
MSPRSNIKTINISKVRKKIKWARVLKMAQKGATISSPGGNKGANIGARTRFAKCATICSNTTK